MSLRWYAGMNKDHGLARVTHILSHHIGSRTPIEGSYLTERFSQADPACWVFGIILWQYIMSIVTSCARFFGQKLFARHFFSARAASH